MQNKLFDAKKVSGTNTHPEVSIKKTICIRLNGMIQGFGLAVVTVMTFVILSPAHGEVWNCRFKGQGIEKYKVEIDTKLEIRVESQKTGDRNKVRMLISEDSNKTTVSEGYLQRMSYRERKYWKAGEPPLRNEWDGVIFIPVSNYENHEKPEILKGYFFSIDFPADFTLFRKSSTSEKATAILNTPSVEVPLEGPCRSSQIW